MEKSIDHGLSRRRTGVYNQASTLWGQTIIRETGLTEGELLGIWDFFESLDPAQSGVLQLPEVDYILRKKLFWLSEKQVWALVQELHFDSSRGIAFDDLCLLLAKLWGRRPLSFTYHVRQFPRKSKEQLQKVFKILDKDGNGTLCEEEAHKALESMHVPIQSEAHFHEIFKEIDQNESGTIDFEEFLVLMTKIRKPIPQISCAKLHLTEAEQQRYRDVFHSFDKGVSGLDAQELQNIFTALGFPSDPQKTAALIHELDADESGMMDLDEFYFLLVRLGAGTASLTRVLLHPGASYEDARRMGISLELLWDLGYDDLRSLREAGWGVKELHAAKMGHLLDFRRAGFTAAELRRAGWHAQDLKLAGYSTADLRIGGFSAAALSRVSRDLTFKCIDLDGPPGRRFPLPIRPLTPVGGRRGSAPMKEIQPVATEQQRPQSAPRRMSRWWSTPRLQSLMEGPERSSPTANANAAQRIRRFSGARPLSGLPSRPGTAP